MLNFRKWNAYLLGVLGTLMILIGIAISSMHELESYLGEYLPLFKVVFFVVGFGMLLYFGIFILNGDVDTLTHAQRVP